MQNLAKMPLSRDEFCSKSRYLYEIANYLCVSSQTLRAWLDAEPIEGIRERKVKRLFSPKEVRIILDYFA